MSDLGTENLFSTKGWKECKMGELGEVITGKTPSSKNPEDWGDIMPFITPTDYKNYSKYAFYSIRNLSEVGVNKLTNKVLPENSLMVTCIGSDMGKVAINKIPVITNQQINSIIPNLEIINTDFLYYKLVEIYETLKMYGSNGTAVPIVNKSDFENIEIDIPPLEEQKAIAEILSSLDDKIDLLHRQNKTLEELAQTLFRQWFIEEAKDEWEIKFSDAPIQIIDGDRGTNYPKNIDFFENEYCLFLNAKNVTINGFNFEDCTFITKEKDELLRKGKLSRDDLVLTTRGTVGNVAFYHNLVPFENIRINSGMVILRVDETKISALYLYVFMKSALFSELVIEHTSGSAQPQLPIRDINNISFILPPKDIHNKFMEHIKPIYLKVFNNQKQIQTLENLRDTLLPKLLSGEIILK